MNLTPDLVAQLATTFGPIGAVAIIAWLNRSKGSGDENPVKELVSQVTEINARLIRVETILEERK